MQLIIAIQWVLIINIKIKMNSPSSNLKIILIKTIIMRIWTAGKQMVLKINKSKQNYLIMKVKDQIIT